MIRTRSGAVSHCRYGGMDGVERRPLTPRSGIAALATFALVVGTLAVLVPDAIAVKNTCRAKNVTQGTPGRSNLQAAINAAHHGDKIAVAGVCVDLSRARPFRA